jgi:hypothetical protein
MPVRRRFCSMNFFRSFRRLVIIKKPSRFPSLLVIALVAASSAVDREPVFATICEWNDVIDGGLLCLLGLHEIRHLAAIRTDLFSASKSRTLCDDGASGRSTIVSQFDPSRLLEHALVGHLEAVLDERLDLLVELEIVDLIFATTTEALDTERAVCCRSPYGRGARGLDP